jgi:hypothetical protein
MFDTELMAADCGSKIDSVKNITGRLAGLT